MKTLDVDNATLVYGGRHAPSCGTLLPSTSVECQPIIIRCESNLCILREEENVA